jgi:hypothetical protein
MMSIPISTHGKPSAFGFTKAGDSGDCGSSAGFGQYEFFVCSVGHAGTFV